MNLSFFVDLRGENGDRVVIGTGPTLCLVVISQNKEKYV